MSRFATMHNHCVHCGKEWSQACVMTTICDACEQAGHTAMWCEKCFPRRLVPTPAAAEPPAAVSKGEA